MGFILKYPFDFCKPPYINENVKKNTEPAAKVWRWYRKPPPSPPPPKKPCVFIVFDGEGVDTL